MHGNVAISARTRQAALEVTPFHPRGGRTDGAIDEGTITTSRACADVYETICTFYACERAARSPPTHTHIYV